MNDCTKKNSICKFIVFACMSIKRVRGGNRSSCTCFFLCLVDIILSEYTRNGWSIVPLITQLIQETKQVAQPHTDEYYSLLMCIMMMLRDDITLATEDEAYLLDTIRDTMNDPGT